MGEKERVALGSIFTSAGLTVAKAAIGFLSGSLAILSEAGHSLIDVAATVITYFAVRVSGKPADAEHQYGHGKIESVAALAETALLFVLSLVVIFEAGQRLRGLGPEAVHATAAAFLVIIISIAVDFFRARVLYRVAARTSSQALEADALHFGSDMWSSIAVLFGLAGVAVGFPWADAAAALVVAAFVCLAGWRLGKRTIDTLTDAAPPGLAERVKHIAERIPGVVSVSRVRARPAGPTLFVDLVLGVSRTLPLDRVTAVKERVMGAIRREIPEAEITVSTEPHALDDETVLERVMVIARNRALAVHHVTVHDLGERLSVSLDLELAGNLTLLAAHEVASEFEDAVAEELGPGVEVETHIEPLQPQDRSGRDAGAARIAAVQAALDDLARQFGTLREIHDVRVRATEDGEIVNFHCRVDPSLSVHAVHEKVDDIERALRRRMPEIRRVIGHAEPSTA